MLDGGADKNIWHTQFGFRLQVGTTEAIFIARRCIEKAWSSKGGAIILLALDWAKTFDGISPDALVGALLRFGIAPEICDIIIIL